MAATGGVPPSKFTKCFRLNLIFSFARFFTHDGVYLDVSSSPQVFINCGTNLQPPLAVTNHDHPPPFPTSAGIVVWFRRRLWISRNQLMVINDRSPSQKLMLLLISGIEPNPGPRKGPRFPCTVCSKACKGNQMALACDHCDRWSHKSCVEMSTASYSRLGDSDEQWYCPRCRSLNNSGIYNIPDAETATPSVVDSNQNTSDHQLSSIPSDISSQRLTSTTDDSTCSLVGDVSLNTRRSIDASTSTNAVNQHMSPSHSVLPQRMTSSPKAPIQQKPKQKKSLRILNINFRSARKKGKSLEALIDACNPDIIIGTETWLNKDINSAEIIPNYLGFDVRRRDRTNATYGGILLAAKQDLELSNIKKSENIELISGTVKSCGGKKLTIAAYYRPPNRVDDSYLQTSKQEIAALKKKTGRGAFIIGGDFNLPDIDWTNLKVSGNQYSTKVNETYLDIIAENNLEQQVDFPTRKKNILDIILTTHPTYKVRCKPLPSVANSDHDVVLYDTALAPHRPKPARRKIFLWKKANVEGMKEDMQDFTKQYHPDASSLDVEQMWIDIKGIVMQTVERHIPTKMTAARHSNPWIDTTIRRAIRRKQRAHRKARLTGKKRDMDRYKRLQAQTQYEIRQASRRYMEDVISRDLKTDSKRFWAYVKSKGQESGGVAPLKDRNGFLRSDRLGKAEILSDQFKSVFTEEDTTSIPDKGTSPYPDMPHIQVREEGIRKLLQNLSPDKATGPDGIPAFVLKNIAAEVAPLLTMFFQLSLDTGQVPTEWKQANIVPIFKKGDRSLPANYRPVSLTSIMCKVLEHVIHSNIMEHFDSHNILTDTQHGFRKRRSCETQLLVTTHDIVSSLAEGNQVDIVLLDFSKAFDKVPHQRLLSKLHYYGVRNTTLGWIQAFLFGRTQQVVLEGAHSSPAAVLSGVPQGTVLGPLLFLAYINDMPDVVKTSNTRLFADDALLYRNICNSQDQALLQADLDCLADWENTWQMSFNASKCNTLQVSSGKQPKHPTHYVLHNQTLQSVTSGKYLGVTLTKDLSWTEHVEAVAAKGNRTVGFLRRNLKDCSTDVKSTTYKTMVRPVLEYASTVWDPHLQQDIELLDKVQRRAARYACGNYDRTPGIVTSILQRLQWDSLEQRRKHNRLGMLYKIDNGLVDLNPADFYKRSDSRTRGSRGIHQDFTRHPALSRSFFPRTISEWNKLPNNTTSAPTLESFWHRLGCSHHNLQPHPASFQ